MNHYKEPDQVSMVGGRPVLNSSDCNISLGFLEGILNTRDGRALGEIYENFVRPVGSIVLEESDAEVNGISFKVKRWL
jgi:hypothetical protein